MQHKESAREFAQRRGVELLREGEPQKVIARYLGVTAQTVRKWKRTSETGGPPRPQRVRGRPVSLSAEELAILRTELLRGSVAHGWINDMWTTHRVRDVIYRCFSKWLSQTTTWRILRRSLRWTPQLPTTKLIDRDEAQIDRWRMQEFPRIITQADYRHAHIVFVDEAGFMLAPTIRKTFAPCGERPILRLADPHGRISTACALTFSPVRRHANLIYRLLPDNANYTGQTISEFLAQIAKRLNGPFTIIWDSIPIHSALAVRAFLRSHRGSVRSSLRTLIRIFAADDFRSSDSDQFRPDRPGTRPAGRPTGGRVNLYSLRPRTA
ncbi:MAG: hypothetical protein JWP89_7017 [Schlesneria sp.]|nr:hypothetical protein [Schlesneria sp.]